MHKVHLPVPFRYSEDLDYVRRSRSAVGPLLDALRELATGLGLERHSTELRGQMAHVKFDAAPTSGVGRIRVKVEVNIAETDALFPRVALPLAVQSPWWRGQGEILTFCIEELLGTKLRALYQRRKGRDLFDLWLAMTQLEPDDEGVAAALRHYMGEGIFTFPELRLNLSSKLEDRDFTVDMTGLVTALPSEYTPAAAADLVMERLGRHLRNAPELTEIRSGAWRR